MLLLLARHGSQREISDIQLRTVSGQTGMNSRADTGSKVASDGGRADQEDVRFVFLDHRCKRMGIGLGSVILKLRIVNYDHLVRAVLAQLVRQSLYAGTNQNCSYCRTKILRQVFSFSDQLQRDAADLIVNLLRKNIYTLIFC